MVITRIEQLTDWNLLPPFERARLFSRLWSVAIGIVHGPLDPPFSVYSDHIPIALESDERPEKLEGPEDEAILISGPHNKANVEQNNDQ